ncbi:MAG: hypothetical protein GPJ54_16330 [Candidatus Heimdallarchaeota archaeon]|nr:hypothetical protein [Candidatus Heimdallarchaeota archaeon]
MDSEDKKEGDKVKNAYSNFAQGLVDVEEEDKKAKKDILVSGIENREKISKKTLSSSKLLTEALSKIRTEAGKSAFVGTSGKIKSPKFRRGEFIKLLARELLLIGHEEFSQYGGIISKSKLESHFIETRTNWKLRENDIQEGVSYLVKEKLIPRIDKLNEELDMIHFIARELSTDGKQILMAAQGIDPSISRLATVLNWEQIRVKNAVQQLVSDGMAVMDEDSVYFPGL